MRKLLIYTSAILVLVLLFCCGETPTSTPEGTASQLNRDVFGYYIPRGLTKTSEGLSDGYILFAAPMSPFTYLINRKGEVVHQWKGNYMAFNAYLMDDGSLVQGAQDVDYPVFGFGGPYGRIQKITWDSKIVWDFELATEQEIVHHDFAVMPNGHILAIVYDAISYDDAIAMGRKPELIPKSGPWMEKIVEIVPEGPRGGSVVWEWQVKDHLIQDRDAGKANYGDPAAHPELLDFNVGNPIPPPITQDSLDVLIAMDRAERNQTTENVGADIYHFNAINYHPELDQIVFSSPAISEVFIIDHGTSTEEAAGHQGGKRGKGGDFLYRWGNPQNYRQGDSTNRKLFGQHDVKWIEPGKPGEGNLTVFNNHPPGDINFEEMNSSTNYSMVLEIEPPLTENGLYAMEESGQYGPNEPHWFYMAPDTLSFYSPFISGAHRMENGNTLITEGARGRLFEVTPGKEIVWEYLNPYHGEIRKPNGDPINPMFAPFFEFRSTFIPANHPALAGKELKPLDPQPPVWKMPPMPAEMAGN